MTWLNTFTVLMIAAEYLLVVTVHAAAHMCAACNEVEAAALAGIASLGCIEHAGRACKAVQLNICKSLPECKAGAQHVEGPLISACIQQVQCLSVIQTPRCPAALCGRGTEAQALVTVLLHDDCGAIEKHCQCTVVDYCRTRCLAGRQSCCRATVCGCFGLLHRSNAKSSRCMHYCRLEFGPWRDLTIWLEVRRTATCLATENVPQGWQQHGWLFCPLAD
jgi:hypothetical protein